MNAFSAAGAYPSDYNPYKLRTYPVFPAYENTSGRTAVSADLVGGESTGVILVMGQSLAANSGVSLYTPASNKVQQIHVSDGLVYELKDPVLGASGDAGSYIGRIGDELISAGVWARPIFIPIALGGSTVAEWAPGGDLHHRLKVAIYRARQLGYTIDAILFDQGNAESIAGSSGAAYQASLESLVASIRQMDPVVSNSPIFVATESGIDGTNYAAAIFAAQAAVVAGDATVFAGADIDSLTGATNRVGVHLTDIGNAAAAVLWKNVLDAHFS